MKFLKQPRTLFIAIILSLFLIPFLWLKPGEMDLGGDGSRLYFYDPINYLKTSVLYAIQPIGKNPENSLLFFLPFNVILIELKKVIGSTHLIITLFNSLHLLFAFLSMYGISKELLRHNVASKDKSAIIEICSIFVGFYYILSPIMVRTEWDKAVFTHARIFLGPLIFYFILRFFHTSKVMYLVIANLITFIFSTNFSWGGAPSLFSFYPIAMIYLLIYTLYITKKKINFLGLVAAFGLYLFLHAFHLLPLLANIVDRSGLAYEKIFSDIGKFDIGLEYFLGSAQHITLLQNLLGLPQLVKSIIPYEFLFFVFPLLLLIGLLLNYRTASLGRTRKNFLLLSIFFLITLFMTTANITKIGFAFYKDSFYIPGFSMFRNYYGHWALPYLFFLSLLIGQSLLALLNWQKNMIARVSIIFGLFFLITASAIPFIRGDMINLILNIGQKVELKVPIKMDPEYEKVLSYVRSDQVDGKFLSLPHTESFNQPLAGTQGGMYIGPPIIAHLAGKSDFSGYQHIAPFSDIILPIVKEGDYKSFVNFLSLLNIRYIFHNADPLIMDYFPDFPYSHVRNYWPVNQEVYKKFISQLPVSKDIEFGGKYSIYKLNDEYYLPHIYVAKRIEFFEKKLNKWGYLTEVFFTYKPNYEIRTAFVDPRQGEVAEQVEIVPKIIFTKINPTKYYIKVLGAKDPFMLVFSDEFNRKWKLYLAKNDLLPNEGKTASYFNGDIIEGAHKNIFFNKRTFETWGEHPIADSSHYEVNGYANGWYIKSSDVDSRTDYTLILEMTSQRLLYVSLTISLIALGVCLGWLLMILLHSLSLGKVRQDA